MTARKRSRPAAARLALGGASGLLACLIATTGLAADSQDEYRAANRRIEAASRSAGSVQQAVTRHRPKERSAEERIADATLLIGVKDYDRASNVLNQVVEKFAAHRTAYADGLSLLGETYFLSGQYLSSRRAFTTIIDGADDSRFRRFHEKAAVRLVDIALRLKDFDSLDALFVKLGNVPGAQAGLGYARGKGMLAQGRLGASAASLQSVGNDPKYGHQAAYLLGVVALREAQASAPSCAAGAAGETCRAAPKGPRLQAALQRFRAVTKMARDSPEHGHVIDLAWLAVGRLLYESGNFPPAVEAYNRLERSSPEFATMLYELAWVYVRMSDVVRAQRALEVLAVVAPDDRDVADAALLRGDLMLRAGQFGKSRKVYESVRVTYGLMQKRVEAFLGSTNDPADYFDALSQDQLELFEAGRALPTLVLKWAREGDDGERAFAIIDDVATSRRLIRESNDMIERLNAVLSSPNRIRAVPGLQAGAERGLGLLNSIAHARLALARGMDDESDDLTPQLQSARQKRQALERRLGMVPVSSSDFARRERQATRQWNLTSQALQRLQLEVDTLHATVNGLERILKDGPQAGVVRSPAQTADFKQKLVEQRLLMKRYRIEIDALRRGVEAGKVQVGFGDKRFVGDARARQKYKNLLWKEVKLAETGQGGSDLADYARQIRPLLSKADRVDAKLEAALAEIDEVVNGKTAELREIVRHETANIVDYALQLEALDDEARTVVGEVAMRNFGRVRDRLKDIVLRADVGITEQAWELREEQLTRVRRLKIERARGEQRLREELEEVLDDSADEEDQ